MWLNRYSQHPSPSSSPAPQRRPTHLAPRPSISTRPSSLSILTNSSTDSLPAAAKYPPAHSNLRNQLDASPVDNVPHPLDVLRDILGPIQSDPQPPHPSSHHAANIEFGELTLQEFVDAPLSSDQPSEQPSLEEFEKEKEKFEDLHKSILACDEVLKSVENYLTSFQADLAAVSAEIETLQNRSSALNTKLETRNQVEKLLAQEVDALIVSPAVVRKISDGPIDDAWIKALEDLEKRSKTIDSKAPQSKSAAELKPLLDSLKNKAVERTRDYVVSQIKALRAPGVNAQLVQQNNFMRYKDAFQFLHRNQPQLGQEIGRAYINTMRWFYLHNFSRYKASLEKMNIHIIDKNEVLAQDDATKRSTVVSGSKTQAAPHDAFSLGRRMDMLKGSFKSALSSHIAEEDKSAHYLEAPFRAFNLALMDNASAEYSFLTEFFSKQSYHEINRKFTEIFQPTFALGQALTKQLIDSTVDALGLLITVRLNQHFAFELQRRKVPAMEGYVNGTNMLLWPRFQMVMDSHCESLRKVTSSLSGRPAGSALSLTSSASAPQSIAPHQITQRFANFTQGILALSSEAGDDEPVHNSLGRLRNDFEAFLTKLGKSFAEQKKRERFLANNYSLVGTIIAETEGKMADELKAHFADKAEEFGGR